MPSNYNAMIDNAFMAEFPGFSQERKTAIRALVAQYDVPISKEWGAMMQRARKARGMTQDDLADATGATQPTISDMEAARLGGSKFVPPVCAALGIPSPIFFAKDEYDERWVEAGRFLRARSMRRFLNYLENFEEEAGTLPPDDDQPSPVTSFDGAEQGRGRGRPI